MFGMFAIKAFFFNLICRVKWRDNAESSPVQTKRKNPQFIDGHLGFSIGGDDVSFSGSSLSPWPFFQKKKKVSSLTFFKDSSGIVDILRCLTFPRSRNHNLWEFLQSQYSDTNIPRNNKNCILHIFCTGPFPVPRKSLEMQLVIYPVCAVQYQRTYGPEAVRCPGVGDRRA